MKRTCNGCRALNGFSLNYRCALGYKILEIKKDIPLAGMIYEPTPAEECPKPKTYHDLHNSDFR